MKTIESVGKSYTRVKLPIPQGDRIGHNQCPTCGLLFRSLGAFEDHRIGNFGVDRRCLTGEELMSSGWEVGGLGFLNKGSGFLGV